jgi:hypothetical protein
MSPPLNLQTSVTSGTLISKSRFEFLDKSAIWYSKGRFHKLFNATEPPEGFEPYPKSFADSFVSEESNEETFSSKSVEVQTLSVHPKYVEMNHVPYETLSPCVLQELDPL